MARHAGGAHEGTIFKLTGTQKTIVPSFGAGSDGSNPYSALLNIDNVLNGTATAGGAGSAGTFVLPL
jgi:hypothetical protein